MISASDLLAGPAATGGSGIAAAAAEGSSLHGLAGGVNAAGEGSCPTAVADGSLSEAVQSSCRQADFFTGVSTGFDSSLVRRCLIEVVSSAKEKIL